MDAIILAGDHKKNIKLFSENKAFIMLENTPIVIHLLKKIFKVPEIDKIIIVGPKDRLDTTLKEYLNNPPDNKKIITVEQKDSILENGIEGFLYSIPEYSLQTLSIEQIKIKYKEKSALFLSVDIPLAMPEEISYFISKCNNEDYDFFIGLTPESVMKTYYPNANSPGIIMAYLHFKENLLRVSNIYVIKPFKGNLQYLEKMYTVRYQKKIINIFRFLRFIMDASNTLKILKYYLLMQTALFFTTIKWNKISIFFRKFIPIYEVELALTKLMDCKIKSVEIPFGGIAVDIDNEQDFKSLQYMFKEWEGKQRAFYESEYKK